MRIFVFLLLLATVVWAEPARYTLSNAVIHTAKEPAFRGYVVVSDGAIESVGRGTPPAGEIVDLGGGHLYPGLIDADSSLGLVEVESIKATRDQQEVGLVNPNLVAQIAFRAESDVVAVSRSQGILFSGVNPSGGLISGQGSVMRTWGWTWEDMTVRPKWALSVDWPSVTVQVMGKAKDKKKTLQSAGERLLLLEDSLAEARNYGNEEIVDAKWLPLQPYAKGEAPILIRVRDRQEIESVLKWSKSLGIEVILVAKRGVEEFADELAARKIPVIFETLFNLNPTEIQSYDLHYQVPKILLKKGVKVALSPSGLAFDARELRDLAGRARAFGCSDVESLQMITLNAAEILGVSDRLGSIEKGKEASFVLCDGDLLEVAPVVTRAWGAGKEIDLDDPQKALYRKYRARMMETK